jgi:hypothetical protein
MQCGHLIHAESVYAYYNAASKQVTVVADVFVDPFTDEPHLCPNPIAMPAGAREFIVEAFPRSPTGLHPPLEIRERVTASFPSDATPKSVVVYSMGVDAPERQEVPVGTAPPPVAGPAARVPAAVTPVKPPFEVTGYSATFSYEEATKDALRQALAKLPSPPRNPDVPVSVVVTKITAVTGGFARNGLYLTATAQ